MAGLTKPQLITILNKANPGSRIIKTNLHTAIGAAIVENNRKVVTSIKARNEQRIKQQVQQHVRALHR